MHKTVRLLISCFVFSTLILSLIAFPFPASAQRGPDFIAGRYIIVLEDGVSPQEVAKGHGLVPDFVYEVALNGFAAPISPKILSELKEDSRVKYIEQDQKVFAFVQTIPTGINRIDAEQNFGGIAVDTVTIAIIDTGIDLDHSDLNVVHNTNCARGGPFGGNCKDGDAKDGNGHGTHVAGTAAAIDNGIGVVGVAPGANLWAVKVLGNDGSGWMSWIIGGVDYVTANASIVDVANMSLGCECQSTALDTAISNSVAAGITYVVAAGNSGKDASTFSPANHPDVITVSAMVDSNGRCGGGGPSTSYGDDDTLASFSNFGSKVEIAAPGVNILSTYIGGSYATGSGTSMASPHVAGAAALYIADNPSSTPSQVLNGLLNNAVAQTQQCDTSLNNGFGGFTGSPGSVEPLVYVGGTSSTTNNPPTANAGADQTANDDDATGSEQVTLNGAGSSDSDGSIVSYEWKEGTTVLGTTETITYDFSVGQHTVTLTVTDNEGATDTDTVVVTVNANQAPTANAGADQIVSDVGDGNGSEPVTLNGSGSDPDGTIVSYEWKEGALVLGTTATITYDFSVGSHTVTLTVTDNGGATGTDTVIITVVDNLAPSANAGPDQTASDADGTGSETVTLDGLGSNDPDGSIVNYEWIEGTTLLGNTAIITKDFAVGTHTITLTVTDNGGKTDSDDVVITVNTNQAPTADAGPDQTVTDSDGNGSESVTLNGSGSDPDGTVVSYEWKEGALVLGTTATITSDLSVGTHSLTFTVTDNGGATASDTVVVTINEVSPGVSVSSITPDTVQSGGFVDVTISGSNFAAGAQVSLSGGSGPIKVSNVVLVDGNTITATIITKDGGPPRDRVWDVTVTNPDGSSGTLVDGFTVTVGSIQHGNSKAK